MHPGTSHSELSRAAYAAGCGTRKRDLWVQVNMKGAGVCAQVVELFDIGGAEWVKLRQASLGTFSRPVRAVAACQGVGFCACAKPGNFSQAGVVAPPESLNSETRGISPSAGCSHGV